MTYGTVRFVASLVLALSFLVLTGRAQQQSAGDAMRALRWAEGPTTGDLGGMATLGVPENYQFLDQRDAGKFLELLENPAGGQELGVLLQPDAGWFVVFEFAAEGYVKDTDRNLDADAILASIKEGTEAANDIRRKRGWSPLTVVGWQQRPFYDPQTNNLTWAIRGESEGSSTINHSTRLLGRQGFMSVDLVMSPDQLGDALPAFNELLGGFSFNQGNRYAEFTRGDKVAEYGLTGLIVGGTAVALVKTGLLQKFWKLIVVGFVMALGAIRRFFASSRRRPNPVDQAPDV